MSSTKKNGVTTLNEFKDKHYGPRGTAKREALEADCQSFTKATKASVAPELTDLFGACHSEETAAEIIAEIRNSQISTCLNESLGC